MGRSPCCEKQGMNKGPWTPEEDDILVNYINQHGHSTWRSLPKLAGLLRCGKSCRLRWTNYLRPDIKRGRFTPEEEKLVIQLHAILGNRWAAIAAQLPGRADNEIKNLWNTHLKKRLMAMGLDPKTHEPAATPFIPSGSPASPSMRHMAQWESARLEAEARLSRESLLHNPHSSGNSDSDFFLRLWNSQVGESFRLKVESKQKAAGCQSSVSLASSSSKCGSCSGMTVDTCQASEAVGNNDPNEDDEVEDSSEFALQLLLDFPSSSDMSFLEDHVHNFSIF